jgi:hypothetical protein
MRRVRTVNARRSSLARRFHSHDFRAEDLRGANERRIATLASMFELE